MSTYKGHGMFKVNDAVKVVSCFCGHGFSIGQKVTVMDVVCGRDGILCEDSDGNWWLLHVKEVVRVK